MTEQDVEAEASKTDAWTTLTWRDGIKKAYKTRHFDDARQQLMDCPNEVFRYLSNDILEFAADYYERIGRLDKSSSTYEATVRASEVSRTTAEDNRETGGRESITDLPTLITKSEKVIADTTRLINEEVIFQKKN